ncbi:unnamed protein product, partial [marine sediment metagenome]
MNQNLLIISNRFNTEDLEETSVYIKILKWVEDESWSFSGFHELIIDFSFDDEQLENIQYIYCELEKWLKDSINKGLIVIVICGYEKDSKFSMRIPDEDDKYEKYSYDFLKDLDMEISTRLEFAKCEVTKKEVKKPFEEYFSLIDEISYFTFRHRPTPTHSKSNINIEPISIMEGHSKDTCIGVIIQIGEGFLILLPGYEKSKKKEVLSSLIRISKYFYIKQ